jgi:hypothetical protein
LEEMKVILDRNCQLIFGSIVFSLLPNSMPIIWYTGRKYSDSKWTENEFKAASYTAGHHAHYHKSEELGKYQSKPTPARLTLPTPLKKSLNASLVRS